MTDSDDAEEGAAEVARIIASLRVAIREFMTNPRPNDYRGLFQNNAYMEMARLSGLLVAMGATECSSPIGTVATAINLNRSHKILERMKRDDQLREIGDEL